MTDESCGCCGGVDEGTETAAVDGESVGEDRWVADGPAVDAPLPADLRSIMSDFLGVEVETLGEWTDEFKRRSGTLSMDVDDLCHAGGETEHWADRGDERYYFRCFYDGLLLSELVEEPVDIRTESPEGTVVEAYADGADDLTVDPEGTVVSFGMTTDPPSKGDPTLAETYSAICPYVRAFGSREEYERWAGSVDASTVAMPLADATDLAGRLIE